MGVTRWRGSGGVEGWIFLALSPFHRSHVNSDYYFYCVCTQRFAENFSQAKIVLSGEKACSPDKSLSMVFPNVDFILFLLATTYLLSGMWRIFEN